MFRVSSRDALVKVEGIPADRLLPGSPRASDDATTEGRVEFIITN